MRWLSFGSTFVVWILELCENILDNLGCKTGIVFNFGSLLDGHPRRWCRILELHSRRCWRDMSVHPRKCNVRGWRCRIMKNRRFGSCRLECCTFEDLGYLYIRICDCASICQGRDVLFGDWRMARISVATWRKYWSVVRFGKGWFQERNRLCLRPLSLV